MWFFYNYVYRIVFIRKEFVVFWGGKKFNLVNNIVFIKVIGVEG